MKSIKNLEIKFGDIVFNFKPTEPDEWHHYKGYEFHYCEDYKSVSVYKLDAKKNKIDYSKTILVVGLEL